MQAISYKNVMFGKGSGHGKGVSYCYRELTKELKQEQYERGKNKQIRPPGSVQGLLGGNFDSGLLAVISARSGFVPGANDGEAPKAKLR